MSYSSEIHPQKLCASECVTMWGATRAVKTGNKTKGWEGGQDAWQIFRGDSERAEICIEMREGVTGEQREQTRPEVKGRV